MGNRGAVLRGVIVFVAACGAQQRDRMTAPARYEVGEEATVTIDAPRRRNAAVEAELVLGPSRRYEERQAATRSRRRAASELSTSPAFTQTGVYRVRLAGDGQALAPPVDINVNVDQMTELLAETIAEYKAKTRCTRVRGSGALQWKQYGGIYQHPYTDKRDRGHDRGAGRSVQARVDAATRRKARLR